MARTIQTYRYSTGGKPPRKQSSATRGNSSASITHVQKEKRRSKHPPGPSSSSLPTRRSARIRDATKSKNPCAQYSGTTDSESGTTALNNSAEQPLNHASGGDSHISLKQRTPE
ncbi:hypothetical protein RSOLAG1IB_09721 [Rhizoctonia solani AG-1 IB]|uniref:Uncharacterized protein n=1 Tax=Thanatephorus cucumeris (strain AG1-IB / isolate 7/3/14) TaxID=1108050 RepID=A0A0B7FUJ8_THACB|nr:hypothetical protein RSOLAG1IB_09721 [Rhizoctonia solani AG-1 IB]